ncbi:MAG: YlxR family protein [Anaerolineae bacterium]|nr:YlxR family protein [Anaerolineae bacterium]
MRRKHIPQRTCIGCRQVRAKREMVRVVRTPEGTLVIDKTGKQNGRGAYLCPDQACWLAALKGDRLGKALNMQIGALEKEMLQSYILTQEQ